MVDVAEQRHRPVKTITDQQAASRFRQLVLLIHEHDLAGREVNHLVALVEQAVAFVQHIRRLHSQDGGGANGLVDLANRRSARPRFSLDNLLARAGSVALVVSSVSSSSTSMPSFCAMTRPASSRTLLPLTILPIWAGIPGKVVLDRSLFRFQLSQPVFQPLNVFSASR